MAEVVLVFRGCQTGAAEVNTDSGGPGTLPTEGVMVSRGCCNLLGEGETPSPGCRNLPADPVVSGSAST